MRQTLFFIPDELGGRPTFGPDGWLLFVWIGFCVALLIWLVRRHGWNNETRSYLPFMAVVGLVIAFVLPLVEVPRHGLPVRGYGVMLLTATVAGVGLAVYRARSMGLHPDLILSLAFRMFLCGIIGARLFFVIQYWDVIRENQCAANGLQHLQLRRRRAGRVRFPDWCAVGGGLVRLAAPLAGTCTGRPDRAEFSSRTGHRPLGLPDEWLLLRWCLSRSFLGGYIPSTKGRRGQADR